MKKPAKVKMQSHRGIRLFSSLEEALFVRRPNRFVVVCRQGKTELSAHLPNPGRLRELLLPGVRLLLSRKPGVERKYPLSVAGVEKAGRVIMLDTLRTNAAARALIERNAVSALEGARVVQAEVRHGRSRFDFLLEHNGENLFLEVKSCTLMGKRTAMFPDAVTERGRRHIEELARLAEWGEKVAVLFLVQAPDLDWFMPDFHTDLLFARTFCAVREHVRFIPAAVRWEKDLTLVPASRELVIPWEVLEREVKDRGSYLLVLRLEEEKNIAVGKLGTIRFPAGWYVYVGSAMANLTARLERHRRLRKNLHWHIDYFRAQAQVVSALAIRSSERLECGLAKELASMAQWSVEGFGSSDCSCPTHLFGFTSNPVNSPVFQDFLLYYRMDRLSTMTGG